MYYRQKMGILWHKIPIRITELSFHKRMPMETRSLLTIKEIRQVLPIIDKETEKYVLDDSYKVTKITKADGSSKSYSYNDAGNMISETDEKGQKTTYEYNQKRLSDIAKQSRWNK